jgi:hypothetical protein
VWFQRVLVGLMLALLIPVQFLSSRPRMLTNRPRVVHVADLPASTEDKLDAFIGANAYLIPRDITEPPAGMTARPGGVLATPPKLGYSIREVSALGMPFLAYKENGFVLYVEEPTQYSMTPLDVDGRKLLDQTAGHPVGVGYTFPFWEYLWGWSLILLVAAWGWLWWRAKVRAREESGII